MNTINFIKPVPPSRERELRRWWFLTILIIGGIVLAIVLVGSMKSVMYYQLVQERKKQQAEQNYASVQHQQYSEKERGITERQKKYDTLARYRSHPKNAGIFLTQLSSIVGPTQLQSCTITRKNFEIGCTATSAQHAQQQVHKLTQLEGVQNVSLHSLHKEQQQYKAVLRGEYLVHKKSRT